MFVANGWTIYFHRVFAERYEQLLSSVTALKGTLPSKEYRQRPTVKLFAKLTRAIRETVPADPDAPEYRLKRDLAKFRRMKGHGLADRYRLFWVFSSRLRVIVFLYLNDESTLRKQDAASDPYEVFKRLLSRGEIGSGFDENWEMIQRRK